MTHAMSGVLPIISNTLLQICGAIRTSWGGLTRQVRTHDETDSTQPRKKPGCVLRSLALTEMFAQQDTKPPNDCPAREAAMAAASATVNGRK